MGDLSEIALKTSYHKGEDDIAQQFYLPCMSRAQRYDRAVGFFRSSIFLIAWPALREFVGRGGRMRILCSQILADEDVAALRAGYEARAANALDNRLRAEVHALLEDDVLHQPARILAALVAEQIIEFQVAIVSREDLAASRGRIFHDKLGVFYDDHANVVTFKGSMNETWMGLAAHGNIESVDVAASWMGARDLVRTSTDQRYFETLWRDEYPDLIVRPFPSVALDDLKAAASPDWDEDLEQALLQETQDQSGGTAALTLYPHQAAGLASWEANGRRGILEFATGSGKTLTAMHAIRQALRRGEVVVVVVPDRTLFNQWDEALREGLSDLDVAFLRAGAGHSRWRTALSLWTGAANRSRLVLATLPTASGEDFLAALTSGSKLMLVADEVHRLGAPKRRSALSPSFEGPRLGLSATPKRAGDPEGTAVLLDYFERILEPRYSLADAVRDGVLTRYFYRPHVVRLTPDETARWNDETTQISRLHARLSAGDTTPNLRSRLKNMLIQRARIVKAAEAKVPLAVDVLQSEYERGQRWLVYCDDITQLQAVGAALERAGLNPLPYHSAMAGDRSETLAWFERRGGVITAIKCLDEGVDIPAATHALILASSKNPREFIQRRGRVLRKSDGKHLAYVHDAIVVPPRPPGGEGGRSWDPITSGELARALEFADHADNPAAGADLRLVAIEAGLDWRSVTGDGVEDDSD